MKIEEISIDLIQQLKEKALTKYQQIGKERLEKKQKKEMDFLKQLSHSSQLFKEQLVEKVWNELQECASRGYTNKKFYFNNFKEKFGPVKISTLVKGFRINEQWDTSIYQKLGLNCTPFEQVVQEFDLKGIQLRDVSDITKGTGFWLEVSFKSL